MNDLRSALDLLAGRPEHLVRTAQPINPRLELAGLYRAVGAGTPAPPPARIGPAMLFESVRGYPGWRIPAAMLASRERIAVVLGSSIERLPFLLLEAHRSPVFPEGLGPRL